MNPVLCIKFSPHQTRMSLLIEGGKRTLRESDASNLEIPKPTIPSSRLINCVGVGRGRDSGTSG